MPADDLQKQITALEKRINADELVTRELANRIDAALAIIGKLTELHDNRVYFDSHGGNRFQQIINSYKKSHYPESQKKA